MLAGRLLAPSEAMHLEPAETVAYAVVVEGPLDLFALTGAFEASCRVHPVFTGYIRTADGEPAPATRKLIHADELIELEVSHAVTAPRSPRAQRRGDTLRAGHTTRPAREVHAAAATPATRKVRRRIRFTTETTAALVQLGRANGLSVHGLISAAVMIAHAQVAAKGPEEVTVPFMYPVDVRSRVSPPGVLLGGRHQVRETVLDEGSPVRRDTTLRLIVSMGAEPLRRTHPRWWRPARSLL